MFDPPLAFAENGVEIASVTEPPPYTRRYDLTYQIHDTVVYVALEDKLEGRDIATGSTVWSQPVSDYGRPLPTAPAIAQVGGRAQLFVTFLVTVPGSGTTKDRFFLRVARFDAVAGNPVWIRDIADIPANRLLENPLGVVGANESHVVVSGVRVTGDLNVPPVTVVLDAKTGVVRWQNPALWSFALGGDVIAGVLVERGDHTVVVLTGRSAMNGGEVWRNAEYFPYDGVGDGRAIEAGLFFARKGLGTLVANIETGKIVLDVRDKTALGSANFDECWFDGQRTIVCAGSYINGPPYRVGGFDWQSGQPLWELPDESANRTAPDVATVRNGMIYGSGVILEARTGQDKIAALKVVPDRVVRGFGIVYDGRTLWAHPATK